MYYWSIGTDIKLDFPTEKEFKEAKERVAKACPILCKTCLHENNCDGHCGFTDSVLVNKAISCTYYDQNEEEAARTEKLMEQVRALNTMSTLASIKILRPEAYEVYVELLKKYGVSEEEAEKMFKNE